MKKPIKTNYAKGEPVAASQINLIAQSLKSVRDVAPGFDGGVSTSAIQVKADPPDHRQHRVFVHDVIDSDGLYNVQIRYYDRPNSTWLNEPKFHLMDSRDLDITFDTGEKVNAWWDLQRSAFIPICCQKTTPPTPVSSNRQGYYNDLDFISRISGEIRIGAGVTPLPPFEELITHGWWYINSVDVPQGSQITAARIQLGDARVFFRGCQTLTLNPTQTPLASGFDTGAGSLCEFGKKVRTRIYGEAADNTTPVTSAADAESRTRTTEFREVVWDTPSAIDANDGAIKEGESYMLQDILFIVQEIVDRPGWESGNSMQFFFEDNGSDNFVSPNRGWGTHIELWNNTPQNGLIGPFLDLEFIEP